VARKPEDIPGFDRLTPRAQRILTGNSVYDRPVDQRGTVSRDITQGPPTPRPRKRIRNRSIDSLKLSMTQARDIIGSPALTNHYFVYIAIPAAVRSYIANNYQAEAPEIINFLNTKLSFFCSEATLPVSSYATAEVKDNYLGITQEFAHTRLYTDLDFTFYVDNNYNILRYFELWMDYIGSGAETINETQPNENEKNFYRRFQFPDAYKTSNARIVKFEKDFDQALEFEFINLFPKGLTSIPVSYGPADLLKVTVTLNFDRYRVYRDKLEYVATRLERERESN